MIEYDFFMKKTFKFKLCILLFLVNSSAQAAAQIGRLGIGFTNHLVTNQEMISLKIQRNRSTALGGHFGLDSNSDTTTYALGVKLYKLIYEEPQLNFYSSFAATMFSFPDEEDKSKAKSGYQMDGNFGTEFHFQGLESVGFSFEFGLGLNSYNDKTTVKTNGTSMIKSAVHFYL